MNLATNCYEIIYIGNLIIEEILHFHFCLADYEPNYIIHMETILPDTLCYLG